MTSSARPNLGGLFNGSTPPQRPSRIADPVSPRLVVPPPVPTSDSRESSGPTADEAPAFASWADPVMLVNQYFQFLRTLLDVNQQFAVACVTAVTALPRRVGLRR